MFLFYEILNVVAFSPTFYIETPDYQSVHCCAFLTITFLTGINMSVVFERPNFPLKCDFSFDAQMFFLAQVSQVAQHHNVFQCGTFDLPIEECNMLCKIIG